MKTILVIDDNWDNYAMVADIFSHLGYEVYHAESGKEGIELARQFLPSIVLLDIRMPGMKGWEVAVLLKSQPITAQIPVIAITTLVDFDEKERSFESGCVAFLPRPYDINKLRSLVEHYQN